MAGKSTQPSLQKLKAATMVGRKGPFGSAKIKPLTFRIPEDVVHDFKVFVAKKDSQINIEGHAALLLYLQQAKQEKRNS